MSIIITYFAVSHNILYISSLKRANDKITSVLDLFRENHKNIWNFVVSFDNNVISYNEIFYNYLVIIF